VSERRVALLRGVNVGGKNKLPMASLAKLFAAAGCTDIVTFIQSGNVVFTASAAIAKRLPEILADAIEGAHGFRSPVILRTASELVAAERANPFPGTEGVSIAFLADRPTPAAVKALDPQRSPPDRFVVRSREIYLHLPNGIGKTKLTNAYFDRALATVSTVRNWNTLTKLIALAKA
jgi:uncharacterized protein (DUF1697 family)